MKNILIILFLSITVAVNATTYYISPSGSDSNAGTITQPFLTLTKAWTVVNPGDIIYMRGGVYPSSKITLTGKSGTAGNYIKVWAYNGEKVAIVKGGSYTYSHPRALLYVADGDYLWFKGIEIYGLTQDSEYLHAGLWLYNLNHCIFELMNVHGIGGMGGNVDHCGDIQMINSDFHHNYDPLTSVATGGGSYGNADGLGFQNSVGSNNSVTGCRLYCNSDDGLDLYGSEGYVNVLNTWTWSNGYREDGTTKGGDGSGIKLGDNVTTGLLRTVENCISFKNLQFGFHDNDAVCSMLIYNNISYSNGKTGEWGGGYHFNKAGVQHYIRNNISYADIGTVFAYDNLTHVDHNSWDAGAPTITNADFISVDSTGVTGARKSDGSLPNINFLKLASGSKLIDAGVNVGLPFSGNAPDLGAFEMQAGSTVVIPAFVTASVENATPSLLGMTYNMTLANIVPAASAFSVIVNSITRTVTSVSLTGTAVKLTLASSVAYGDVVTVSYNKPSTNPLQTDAGGQAATISAQSTTNKVNSVVSPVYVSSVVQNSTPLLLEMTYNMALANIVPAASAFAVLANGVTDPVNSLSILGSKVQLTLSSAIKYGDIITVTYSKPALNPLQSSTAGQAISITGQSVINNLIIPTKDAATVSVTISLSPLHIHKVVNIQLAYSAALASASASITPEIIRISDLLGKLCIEKMIATGVTNIKIPLNLRSGIYIVQLIGNSQALASKRMVIY